ncbi:hypothetical protein GJ496_009840, partial [Pomphorhynchus laevis]
FEFKRRRFSKRRIKLKISCKEILICDEELKGSEKDMILMRHALCRVYYASHDNENSKVFGYFADADHKAQLQCNVFKADRESQANSIVQEIGRCFEIFYLARISVNPKCEREKELPFKKNLSNTSSGYDEDSDERFYDISNDVNDICEQLRNLQRQTTVYQKELSDVQCRLHKIENTANNDASQPVYLQVCQSKSASVPDNKFHTRLPYKRPHQQTYMAFGENDQKYSQTSFEFVSKNTYSSKYEEMKYQLVNEDDNVVPDKASKEFLQFGKNYTNWKSICSKSNIRIAENSKSSFNKLLYS